LENSTCSAASPTTSLFHFISFAIILVYYKNHTTKSHVIWCGGLSDPAHKCLKSRVHAAADLAYVPCHHWQQSNSTVMDTTIWSQVWQLPMTARILWEPLKNTPI
jgi:hypothetical protein